MALTDKLTNIADAIRSKTGSTDSLTLDAMPEAIESIETSNNQFFIDFMTNNGNGRRTITPDDLTGIRVYRSYAFAGWQGTSITFPAGASFIADGTGSTFFDCSNLTSVNLPTDLTDIVIAMFKQCGSLEQITLPSTIKSIKSYAFTSSGLKSITIPAGCKYIYQYAFSNCDSLSTVVFEGKPDEIDKTAFSGCAGPIDIYVPWAEGEVADAPWSTSSGVNITVHYNSQGGNT